MRGFSLLLIIGKRLVINIANQSGVGQGFFTYVQLLHIDVIVILLIAFFG